MDPEESVEESKDPLLNITADEFEEIYKNETKLIEKYSGKVVFADPLTKLPEENSHYESNIINTLGLIIASRHQDTIFVPTIHSTEPAQTLFHDMIKSLHIKNIAIGIMLTDYNEGDAHWVTVAMKKKDLTINVFIRDPSENSSEKTFNEIKAFFAGSTCFYFINNSNSNLGDGSRCGPVALHNITKMCDFLEGDTSNFSNNKTLFDKITENNISCAGIRKIHKEIFNNYFDYTSAYVYKKPDLFSKLPITNKTLRKISRGTTGKFNKICKILIHYYEHISTIGGNNTFISMCEGYVTKFKKAENAITILRLKTHEYISAQKYTSKKEQIHYFVNGCCGIEKIKQLKIFAGAKLHIVSCEQVCNKNNNEENMYVAIYYFEEMLFCEGYFAKLDSLFGTKIDKFIKLETVDIDKITIRYDNILNQYETFTAPREVTKKEEVEEESKSEEVKEKMQSVSDKNWLACALKAKTEQKHNLLEYINKNADELADNDAALSYIVYLVEQAFKCIEEAAKAPNKPLNILVPLSYTDLEKKHIHSLGRGYATNQWKNTDNPFGAAVEKFCNYIPDLISYHLCKLLGENFKEILSVIETKTGTGGSEPDICLKTPVEITKDNIIFHFGIKICANVPDEGIDLVLWGANVTNWETDTTTGGGEASGVEEMKKPEKLVGLITTPISMKVESSGETLGTAITDIFTEINKDGSEFKTFESAMKHVRETQLQKHVFQTDAPAEKSEEKEPEEYKKEIPKEPEELETEEIETSEEIKESSPTLQMTPTTEKRKSSFSKRIEPFKKKEEETTLELKAIAGKFAEEIDKLINAADFDKSANAFATDLDLDKIIAKMTSTNGVLDITKTAADNVIEILKNAEYAKICQLKTDTDTAIAALKTGATKTIDAKAKEASTAIDEKETEADGKIEALKNAEYAKICQLKTDTDTAIAALKTGATKTIDAKAKEASTAIDEKETEAKKIIRDVDITTNKAIIDLIATEEKELNEADTDIGGAKIKIIEIIALAAALDGKNNANLALFSEVVKVLSEENQTIAIPALATDKSEYYITALIDNIFTKVPKELEATKKSLKALEQLNEETFKKILENKNMEETVIGKKDTNDITAFAEYLADETIQTFYPIFCLYKDLSGTTTYKDTVKAGLPVAGTPDSSAIETSDINNNADESTFKYLQHYITPQNPKATQHNFDIYIETEILKGKTIKGIIEAILGQGTGLKISDSPDNSIKFLYMLYKLKNDCSIEEYNKENFAQWYLLFEEFTGQLNLEYSTLEKVSKKLGIMEVRNLEALKVADTIKTYFDEKFLSVTDNASFKTQTENFEKESTYLLKLIDDKNMIDINVVHLRHDLHYGTHEIQINEALPEINASELSGHSENDYIYNAYLNLSTSDPYKRAYIEKLYSNINKSEYKIINTIVEANIDINPICGESIEDNSKTMFRRYKFEETGKLSCEFELCTVAELLTLGIFENASVETKEIDPDVFKFVFNELIEKIDNESILLNKKENNNDDIYIIHVDKFEHINIVLLMEELQTKKVFITTNNEYTEFHTVFKDNCYTIYKNSFIEVKDKFIKEIKFKENSIEIDLGQNILMYSKEVLKYKNNNNNICYYFIPSGHETKYKDKLIVTDKSGRHFIKHDTYNIFIELNEEHQYGNIVKNNISEYNIQEEDILFYRLEKQGIKNIVISNDNEIQFVSEKKEDNGSFLSGIICKT